MQHPPDEEQGDERADHVNDPVACGARSAEVEHALSFSQGLKPAIGLEAVMPGLKSRPISEAKANTGILEHAPE